MTDGGVGHEGGGGGRTSELPGYRDKLDTINGETATHTHALSPFLSLSLSPSLSLSLSFSLFLSLSLSLARSLSLFLFLSTSMLIP